MRDYVFVNKDTKAKATLRTDIIDGNERFTIMWLEGVQGTEFEKIMPFKPGTVITKEETEEWFETFQGILDGYIYGGEQVVLMGAETFDLTITPTITGASVAPISLTGTKEGAEPIQDVIELKNSEVKVLKIIDGWEYKIQSTNGGNLSGDNDPFTASEDKSIAITIAYES